MIDGKHRAFLAAIEPPKGLCEAILTRIESAKRRGARVRSGLFALLAMASGVALVPVWQYTTEQFYASGFSEYLTLIASDRSAVLPYWKEIGLSLIESLPSIALLVLIPILAALLWSLVRLVKNVRSAFIFA
jgi:cation transport ATPase